MIRKIAALFIILAIFAGCATKAPENPEWTEVSEGYKGTLYWVTSSAASPNAALLATKEKLARWTYDTIKSILESLSSSTKLPSPLKGEDSRERLVQQIVEASVRQAAVDKTWTGSTSWVQMSLALPDIQKQAALQIGLLGFKADDLIVAINTALEARFS
ncbi:MAG: hypothetical protein PHI83_08765 [Sphaerochaetaceae bacterium]|nr:hypothetical protein [Sphaerochaetaceae bacterium]